MLVSRRENDLIHDVMEACNFIQVLCWYCILKAYICESRLQFTNRRSEASDSDCHCQIGVGGSAKQTTR